jgi:hypothetical protein
MLGFDALKATRTYNGMHRYYEVVGEVDMRTQPFTNKYGFGRILGNDTYEEVLMDTSSESTTFYRMHINLDE